MYRGSGPRILPLLAVIVVVALVIAAVVTAGRMLFSGNSDKNNQTTSKDAKTMMGEIGDAVLDRGLDRHVRWTVRGPIVADEKFRSYQITIGPSSRTYTVFSGYLDQVISTKTYDNNANAYEQFVYALMNANVSATRKDKDTDFRGVCATQGVAYMFETLHDDTVDHELWSSTCKGSKGTLGADPLKIQALFVNQIPDFQPIFNSVY